jgi:phage gpG-like protein
MHFEPPVEFILQQTGAFQAALLDLEVLWELFKPIMSEIEEQQFDSHGAGAWPSLSESTLEQKGRGGWPSDPLVRSGDLKNSLTDPGRAAQTGPTEMSYGTDVPYAGYHQDGTSKMPQRQVISDPFRVEDRRKLEVAMVTYINRAAAATFGRI